MKCTYWYAECLNDSDAYAIRAKTKKAALAQREERDWQKAEGGEPCYGPVIKVVIEYRDAFDLVEWLMGEGRGSDESYAAHEYEKKLKGKGNN